MGERVAAFVVAGALMVSAGASAQDQAGEAARNWSAIAECGAISDPQRRLSCMDDVLVRAGVLEPAQVAQAQLPAPAASGSQPAPASAAAAPPSRLERARALETELATTVAAVRTIGFQRVRITAADGTVWDQTQAQDFRTPPEVGDAFTVEPAALGSFRCQVAGSSRYRCEPAG